MDEEEKELLIAILKHLAERLSNVECNCDECDYQGGTLDMISDLEHSFKSKVQKGRQQQCGTNAEVAGECTPPAKVA